ncbi:MAG: PD40 domain-containing protein [Myxococcales bacterium]|nr:PD40 domain-containing protein [Myxococcales bacterium]
MRTPLLIAALLLVAGPAAAQGDESGIEFTVGVGDVVRFNLAVPDAVNQGGEADTRGITEALSGTVVRDLTIAAYFNLIDKKAFLVDPAKEGMNPDYVNWINIGTQGLVKIGYTLQGEKVTVDMRLYRVDRGERVKLPAPYDGPAILPTDTAKLRYHAHGFVNEIMRYFTNSPGFFNTRIVLVKQLGRAKELFMVSPDGLDEVQLTNTGGINMLPALGGGRIFFTSFRNGGTHLFTLSGGEAKPLSSYQGLNMGAALSPDGRNLAVTLSKEGNPEIFLIDPNTGAVNKRLTNDWGIDASPAWSPDGGQIAFVSDRHGSPQIWVMNADGSNPRRLTFQGEYNQTPDWSPRGDKIAFTARDERNVFDLFTVDVADGSITRLTQNQGNNEEPTWSPDGRYIAFVSTRSGQSKLYIMTADGRIQTPVSTGKGTYITPNWGR